MMLRNKKTIVVLGMGYVGFPLSVILARSGFNVIGVDTNSTIVESVNQGSLNIGEKEVNKIFQEAAVKENLSASGRPVKGDVFIIAVPTPLNERKKVADLSYVIEAAHAIIPVIDKGNLIVIESTVPPLTLREKIIPILETETELEIGRELFLAHCPERVLPGNVFYELIHNNRIIGGHTAKASAMAKSIYGSFVKGDIYITDDCTAEIVKLMENTYRDVNVALANEFDEVCQSLGINSQEAINLANNHPRVNILKPGIGVGGHCLPVDPWFIKEVDPENSKLIFTAREINSGRPAKMASKVRRLLRDIPDPEIVALGVTYKAETYDTRESPAITVISLLQNDGYKIEAYDPFAEGYNYGHIQELVKGKDCLLVLVEHKSIVNELEADLDTIRNNMRTPLIIRYTT